MISTYPYPEITVEKPSCAPETAIYGHGPSNEYIGWPNIFDDIDL